MEEQSFSSETHRLDKDGRKTDGWTDGRTGRRADSKTSTMMEGLDNAQTVTVSPRLLLYTVSVHPWQHSGIPAPFLNQFR